MYHPDQFVVPANLSPAAIGSINNFRRADRGSSGHPGIEPNDPRYVGLLPADRC